MCRIPSHLIIRRPPTPTPVIAPTPIKPVENFTVPLQSSKVDVQIVDFIATTTITQNYKNTESNPIEAEYQFFLQEKHTVSDFSAVVDGKTIKGTVQEKEEAKNTYSDAIASGGGAYLMAQTEEDANVFSVSVGNIPPGKEVQIKITYIKELEFDSESRLVFSIESDKSNRSQLTGSSPSTDLNDLKLKIDLKMTSNIKQLSSPSHPIAFEFGDEPTQATVTLSSDAKIPATDFVLLTKLAKPHQPVGRIQKDAKGNVGIMAALYPEFKLGDDEEIYTEMIFLIDRSGSMAGSRIEQVKETLLIFLRSLSEGTMFNIVGFGSRSEFLFKSGSVEYNDSNLETATTHVKNLKANLGGTNVLQPLKDILQKPSIEGYPRQLFILTDGEVNNTTECVNYVRMHADTTRVFTFGVGAEASQALVKGMAKSGEGEYEFCLPGQSMESKVMKQLNRAMLPSLTNVKLTFDVPNSHKMDVAPFQFPPLFSGKRVIGYAILDSAPKQKFTATFEGVAGGIDKHYKATVEIDPEKIETGNLVLQLAARNLIRDLEESRSSMHEKGGTLKSGKSATDVKRKITEISIKFNVLSKETAFVAVEEREDATEGTMSHRKFGIDISAPKPPPPGGLSSSSSYSATPLTSSAVPLRQSNSSDRSRSVPGGGGAGPVLGGRPGMGRGGPPPMAPSSSIQPQVSISKRAGPPAGPPPPSSSSYGAAASAPAPSPKRMSSVSSSFQRVSEGASLKQAPQAQNFDSADFSLMKSKDKEEKSHKRKKKSNSPRGQQMQSLSSNFDLSNAALDADEEERSEQKQEDVPKEMKNIIMKQKASGEWSADDVDGLLGKITEEKMKAAMEKVLSGKSGDVFGLWVTAVVMSYLKKVFKNQETNWSQVVKKAGRFIAKQKKGLNVDVDVVAEAEKFVEQNK